MYRERASVVPGGRLWSGASDGARRRILPDGCMDLLWTEGHLVVAGPDSVSFVAPASPVGTVTTGLRFAPGAAPAVLGMPADAFRNQRVRLDDVWPADEVARAEELVAGSTRPGAALEQIAATFGRGPVAPDPLAVEIVRRARAGERVATMAPAVGMSARQLQRRAHDLFGYGPKLLARILRLGQALDLARRGEPLAMVAATCGYADQAHLADDVRELAGTTLGGLGVGEGARRPRASLAPAARRHQLVGAAAGSGANRSTGLPSGSRTVA